MNSSVEKERQPVSLSVKIKADGKKVSHAGILGTVEDQNALIELLEAIMPAPQAALATLREAKYSQLQYPAVLTPELEEVLGWPNFKCGPFAEIFRAASYEIPRKAEREQAFVLHWLTGLVLKYGAGWRDKAGIELDAMRDKVAAKGHVQE